MNGLIPLAILAAAWHFFGRKLLNAPKINYVISSFSLQYKRIGIDIINPTKTEFELNSFVADIIYNGSRLGLINYTEPKKIPPLATTRFTFPLVLENTSLAKEALNVFGTVVRLLVEKKADKPLSNQVTIQGTMNVGSFNVPVAKTITLF